MAKTAAKTIVADLWRDATGVLSVGDIAPHIESALQEAFTLGQAEARAPETPCKCYPWDGIHAVDCSHNKLLPKEIAEAIRQAASPQEQK